MPNEQQQKKNIYLLSKDYFFTWDSKIKMNGFENVMS